MRPVFERAEKKKVEKVRRTRRHSILKFCKNEAKALITNDRVISGNDCEENQETQGMQIKGMSDGGLH